MRLEIAGKLDTLVARSDVNARKPELFSTVVMFKNGDRRAHVRPRYYPLLDLFSQKMVEGAREQRIVCEEVLTFCGYASMISNATRT